MFLIMRMSCFDEIHMTMTIRLLEGQQANTGLGSIDTWPFWPGRQRQLAGREQCSLEWAFDMVAVQSLG